MILLPELFIKKAVMGKLAIRLDKCSALVETYCKFVQESCAQADAFFVQVLSLCDSFGEQLSGAEFGRAAIVRRLLSLVEDISKHGLALNKSILGRVVGWNLSDCRDCAERAKQKVHLFMNEAVDFKEEEKGFSSSLQNYNQLIYELRGKIEENNKSSVNPLVAYDVDQIRAFKREIEHSYKQIGSAEVRVNHEAQNLISRRRLIKHSAQQLRQLIVEAVGRVSEKFTQLCSKVVFSDRRPLQAILRNKMVLSPRQQAELEQEIERNHPVLPQLLTRYTAGRLEEVRLVHAGKQKLLDFLVKLLKLSSAARTGAFAIEKDAFGPNKRAKFQKNIKKYFGLRMFEIYQQAQFQLSFSFAVFDILHRVVFATTESLRPVFEIDRKKLIQFEKNIKAVKASAEESRRCIKRNEDSGRLMEELASYVKSVVGEHRIHVQFNAKVTGMKIDSARAQIENEVGRLLSHVAKAGVQFGRHPRAEIEAALSQDQKKKQLLFNSFFQDEYSVAQYKESAKFEAFIKQTYLKINIAFYESEMNSECGCFSSSVIEHRPLKKYKCSLSAALLLPGVLHVGKRGLLFKSSFSSSAFIFGSTTLLVPRQEVLRLEKNDSEIGIEGRLRVHTEKGVLDFGTFFRRDKAFWFIKNEFGMEEEGLHQCRARADKEKEKWRDTQVSMVKQTKDEEPSFNHSLMGSLLSKSGLFREDAVVQQTEQRIELPGPVGMGELVAALLQFHQKFVKDLPHVLQYEARDGQVRFEYNLTIDQMNFSVTEEVAFVCSQQLGTGSLQSKVQAKLFRGKGRNDYEDTLQVRLWLEGNSLCYLFAKDSRRQFSNYYQDKFMKELRCFYARLFSEFEEALREKRGQEIVLETTERKPIQQATPASRPSVFWLAIAALSVLVLVLAL